jgi:group II intron reverse transcriptase/maturase
MEMEQRTKLLRNFKLNRKGNIVKMSKTYDLTKEEVANAWNSVKRAKGSEGIDGTTIKSFEENLDRNLYRIWNRMASGSMMFDKLLKVKIPKAKGGCRILGIPTIKDRVVQTVIKNRLESLAEATFHEDSYGYRPGKSAIDAVGKARTRCFKCKWTLDIDIHKFFDEIPHKQLIKIVEDLTDDKMVRLYIRRYLGVGNDNDLEKVEAMGIPQGGVISPLLANIFLNEVFDNWMAKEYRWINFERYADDLLVHFYTKEKAEQMMELIIKRFETFGLKLNMDKSKIVFCGNDSEPEYKKHKYPRKFTFLGYDFKPRRFQKKTVFTPGIGTDALNSIGKKLKKMNVLKRTQESIENVASKLNPLIRGWINYYGNFRRSALKENG